ncbi:hypothetical protein [Mycobacterium sp. shizuoka-1]|uniref:hypothetical protein n=1 Tax=Mycobacterium sp. shizuoka-1 TaxID=2039281 RepID=UPI000C06758F|nr:hypothetical protein [Mycobacterium sp. shizuoka-1]GAY14236.1 hypothetical protein MSZK_09620 [Mycobacterium sp. shizuoka-1]
MTRPVVDWRRATLIGAVGGGVFWGLTAGAILGSKGSAIVVAELCVTAAVVVIAGVSMYRRATSSPGRDFGMGLVLAPLTGLAPLLAMLPGVVVIFWKG